MNKVFITGRAVRDPTYYEEKVGKESQLSFSLAYNDFDGKGTIFLNCVCYGAMADRWSGKVYQGVKLLVHGKLVPFGKGIGLMVSEMEIVGHTKEHEERFGKRPDNFINDGFIVIDEDEKLPWEI